MAKSLIILPLYLKTVNHTTLIPTVVLDHNISALAKTRTRNEKHTNLCNWQHSSGLWGSPAIYHVLIFLTMRRREDSKETKKKIHTRK